MRNLSRQRYWKNLTSGKSRYDNSHAKKNGTKTPLSLLSNMTMPTTRMTASMPRTKVSNVICFLSITSANIANSQQN